jgi:hypothetical protein
MIDNTKISTSSFSGDTIRDFLLGRLRGREQSSIEERLFTDEQFEVRVKLEELGLADDYARGHLSANDRKQFRTVFLVSIDRNQSLNVSRALHERLVSDAPARVSQPQSFQRWLAFGQPVWRYTFAALLLALVFATAWRAIKEPSIVEQIVPGRIQPRPKASATQPPEETNHSNSLSSPSHPGTEPTPPAHQLPATAINLDQNNTADHPAVLPARLSGDKIRLQLLLPKKYEGVLRLELLRNGEIIFNTDSATPTNGETIFFDIPPGTLQIGDYEIKVSAEATSMSIANYYLRLQ